MDQGPNSNGSIIATKGIQADMGGQKRRRLKQTLTGLMMFLPGMGVMEQAVQQLHGGS
jgi:hypothetical protein